MTKWTLPVLLLACALTAHAEVPLGKRLGSVLNNDIDNLLAASSGEGITVAEYRRGVDALLDGRPGVLAQNVGFPDPVIYRSSVATTWDKYHAAVALKRLPKSARRDALASSAAVRRLFALGSDPLEITISAARARGVLVVASFRMNSEDYQEDQPLLSDMGREHPEWMIPGAHCLDPAVPEVYAHRMRMFKEVLKNYDLDGIELDFGRWTRMVSKPMKNHVVLTRMVAELRALLDESARRKKRAPLILGARVGYSLEGPDNNADLSCKSLGLDVKTWLAQNLLDYVAPSYFWPRLPGVPRTDEFVALAKGTRAGVYPTLWPLAAWMEDKPVNLDDPRLMRLYRHELAAAALRNYALGADGISTYNWVFHHIPPTVLHPIRQEWGLGAKRVQLELHRSLGSAEKIKNYIDKSK